MVGMVYVMARFVKTSPPEAYYNGIRDAYIALGFGEQVKTVLEPARLRSEKRMLSA